MHSQEWNSRRSEQNTIHWTREKEFVDSSKWCLVSNHISNFTNYIIHGHHFNVRAIETIGQTGSINFYPFQLAHTVVLMSELTSDKDKQKNYQRWVQTNNLYTDEWCFFYIIRSECIQILWLHICQLLFQVSDATLVLADDQFQLVHVFQNRFQARLNR